MITSPHIARRHSRSGFTLAETMVSATIVSTALISALSLLSSGVSATKDSHQEAAAVLLARRVAGEVQSLAAHGIADTYLQHVEVYDAAQQPVGCPAAGDGTPKAWGSSDYSSGVQKLGAAYLVSWQMTAPAAADPQVAKVKITVETPPTVVKKNRHVYTYATLVRL